MTRQTRKTLITSILLVLSIIYLACTFKYRRELGWWAFIEPFALFMSEFTELMSIFIGRMIPTAGKTLNMISYLLGAVFVIFLIVECIMLYMN